MRTTSPSRSLARSALAVVLVLGAAVTLGAAGLGRARALRDTWPAEADTMYLPSARVLRLLALGHSELAADLVAARANVYFGTQMAAKAPQRHLERYFHTAIDLDPRFHRLYLSAPAMLVYDGQPITVDRLLAANRVLARGRQVFPGDWELAFQLGFNEFFELPQHAGENDPRTPRWRQSGIEHLRQATLYEGGPFWLPNLVARLLTKEGQDELALMHLQQAYAATKSEEARLQILGKLRLLENHSLAGRMEQQRREFEDRLREAYPFAPEAFSIIAGPRRGRAVELPLRAPAPPTP
jgi:hypothetical protein